MKLQRSTLILVGIALALGVGVSLAEAPWTESRQPDQPPRGQKQNVMLNFLETDVVGVRVERPGETLTLERNSTQGWKLTSPLQKPAEPGAVAFLLSRLNTDSPMQTLTMDADRAQEFGFNQPTGTVTVSLVNGNQHRLILGGSDFSGTAYYAVVDPAKWPPSHGDKAYRVLVVSADVANGISRPLAEWQMADQTSRATPGE
ncbi:MAG: DUF4340 domain-containing protein [Cyanobacteria bacterium REEB459]|nr:DUF4340 domain-containing protein [Cyanobacteria bacterium REEB459]